MAPPVGVHRERRDLGMSTEQAAWPSGWGVTGVMSPGGPGCLGCFCGQLLWEPTAPLESRALLAGSMVITSGIHVGSRVHSPRSGTVSGHCEGAGRPRKVNLPWSPHPLRPGPTRSLSRTGGGLCPAGRPSGRPQQLPRDHGRWKEVPGLEQAVSFISSRHAPGLPAGRSQQGTQPRSWRAPTVPGSPPSRCGLCL